MELLLGCGSARDKRIALPGQQKWDHLVTCDFNSDHNPDVVHDLEALPWPWPDDTFQEIHAYELLEHIGTQGDWRTFFSQFSEIYRILKPGGVFCATCPSYKSMWAWGDPSHRRVIASGTLAFLDQEQYTLQVGKTVMSDFRFTYRADFKRILVKEDDDALVFAIQAVKPSRWRPAKGTPNP